MRDRPATHALPGAALLLFALAIGVGPVSAQAGGWEMRVCADPSSMPFSSDDGRGFENEIAGILAAELGARVTYDWHYFNSDIVRLELRAGNCDVLMGVPDGYDDLLTTVAYYQSPYVLLYRPNQGYELSSFDDPVLRTLKIGVQSTGIPPQTALVEHGLGANIVATYRAEYGAPDRLAQVVRAVANGDIDVGVAWGPQVGYYAGELGLDLTVVPMTSEFDPASLPMTVPMTIAVRHGDVALRDALNVALATRWAEVQAVIERYRVPVEPLPPPGAPADGPRPELLEVGLVVPNRTGPSVVPEVSLYDVVGQAAVMGGQLAAETSSAQAAADAVELRLLLASAPSAGAAERAADRLLAVDGVAALVGGLGAGQAEVLAGAAEGAGVPFLNIGSPAGPLRTACLKTTFSVEASASMYLAAAADWFTGHGYARWFVVYEETGEGTELRDAALGALATAPGAALVGSAGVVTGRPDYGPVLEEVRRSGADLVLVLVNAPDQIAFLAQQESVGPHVAALPYPYPVTQTRDFLGAMRLRADAQGLGFRVALWEATLGEQAGAGLNDRFVARWGQPMDPAAWAAYAAVTILHDAAVAAGSTLPEAIAAYLGSPEARFEVGKATPLSFDPSSHQLRQPLYVVELDPDAQLTGRLNDQRGLAKLVDVVEVAAQVAAEAEALETGPGMAPQGASRCR
ncbi:MAG: quinoprotein dehydrogenase-associated putative ABC transporter substrate-binding protein [Trueperaceae bacterium]|nr:quinoprotein dehydrogenase-associated putative ABC transporter substrate-binding protein [Trueperaceae bacterium]